MKFNLIHFRWFTVVGVHAWVLTQMPNYSYHNAATSKDNILSLITYICIYAYAFIFDQICKHAISSGKVSNLYPVYSPDCKVHGTSMGPAWVLSAPDGPHVGPMNLAVRGVWSCCNLMGNKLDGHGIDHWCCYRLQSWVWLDSDFMISLIAHPFPDVNGRLV